MLLHDFLVLSVIHTLFAGDRDMDQPSYDEENIPSKKIVDPDTNADAFQDSILNETFDNATDTRPNGLHETRIKAVS